MEQVNNAPPGKPRSMFTAYALWLVLGWFGAHRFFLGKKDAGIGYVALTGSFLAISILKYGSGVIDTYSMGLAGPIAMYVFAAFIALMWVFDGVYTATLVRISHDPSHKAPLDDVWQPFVDLARAPRALWGVNLSYCLEGWVYFGMLGYLAMHFSDFVFKGIPNADVHSHHMVGILTAGITLSMFFFGSVADKRGVRWTLLTSFLLLLAGRVIWSSAANVFPEPGLRSGMHMMTVAGIILVIIGYGLYQPAAYAGVRQFSSPRTAAMNYAMLYALMNLGGWLPSFFTPIRERVGINGAFWVYTGITLVALLSTFLILTRKVVTRATDLATKEREAEAATAAATAQTTPEATAAAAAAAAAAAVRTVVPVHMWIALPFILAVVAGFIASLMAVVMPEPLNWAVSGACILIGALFVFLRAGLGRKALSWLANHPLSDLKFFFFIFALIPVQTLFTYNWLILPQYLERAFQGGVVSEKFEIFANLNPMLIFFGVPLVAALTQRSNMYFMMVLGTLVMALPAFFLAAGTTLPLLMLYLFIMTIGEAMWQPRFLQYAAEIAPEGRTGAYMGVAQFPWYLTKMIVPFYSGFMLQKFVPAEGARNPEQMWLIFAFVAISSPIALLMAKNWVGKGFKTKA